MRRNMPFRTVGSLVIGVMAAAVLALHTPPRVLADPTVGDVFTVNTINDLPDNNIGDGICWTGATYDAPECTLRAALDEANGNGNPGERDSIEFDIDAPIDIQITSTLSIAQPVSINGYSQNGASANTANSPEPFNGTVKVLVSAAAVTFPNSAIQIGAGASDSIISGLAINQNAGPAIYVGGQADNVQIYGNYIGTDVTGLINGAVSDDSGDLLSISEGATATHVGGVLPAQRNILAGSSGTAIYIHGLDVSSGGFIQGNYIGVGADGVTTLANAHGITLEDGVNGYLVGGDSLAAGNVIENNLHSGVRMNGGSFNNQIVGNRVVANTQLQSGSPDSGIGAYGALDSVIRGNTIAHNTKAIKLSADGSDYSDGIIVAGNNVGVLEDGVAALPNKEGALLIDKANNSIIGGTDPADANIIAYNQGANSWDSAITLANNSTNIAIIGNSILGNNGLGIDHYGTGVTENDFNDNDAGTNNLLNFPEGKTAVEAGGDTTIDYRLNAPAGQYRIEFFSNADPDPSGHGEGQTLIGHQNITKNGNGYQTFSNVVDGTGHTNLSFTATQIDENTPSGFGSTSEFGAMLAGDESDLRITKTLNNPRDIAPGAPLSYTVTITNDGYTSYDIAQLDGSGGNPFATSLFMDIMPPDLTFGSVVGSEVVCSSYGPGSASLTPFLLNHADHELVSCAYEGGSRILDEGESYSTTFSVTVGNDSDLLIDNIALVGMAENDPSLSGVNAAFGTDDLADTLLEEGNNNVTSTGAITDLSITKEIIDEEAPVTDGTIQYKIVITNNSGASVDLEDYDDRNGPFGNYLFADALPPELSDPVVTGDASCVGPVPGSSTGPAFASHGDYNLLVCAWSAGSYMLDLGESVEFTVSASVAQPVPSTFTNYAFLGLFGPDGFEDMLNDPDTKQYLSLPDLANTEVIDANLDLVSQNPEYNNFAQAVYGEAPGNGGDGGGNNSPGSASSGGGLSATGQNILVLVGLAIILLSGGAIILAKLRKKKGNGIKL